MTTPATSTLSRNHPIRKNESLRDFKDVYLHMCALKDLHPCKMVTLFLDDNILDIHVEKLDNNDWQPVIEALKISRHKLRFIAIRCSSKNFSVKKVIKRNTVTSKVLHLESVLGHVTAAIGCTLSKTQHLTCLELQNLQLTAQDLTILNNGLASNSTLQHLSFQQCSIGDSGVESLCKVLKNCFNVTSLNISQCQLCWKSADFLVALAKHQTVHRHSDSWKETLRNEIAILDRMGGVQRITLNGNPEFGDRGAQILAEVLHDDLWLKALDLQDCGVQDRGAAHMLSALKHNTTLFILDLRENFIKDSNLLLRISQQLSFNAQGHTSQFKWFKLPAKNTQRSNCSTNSHYRKRGIPWRVTARLGAIRHFPAGQMPGIAYVFQHTKPTMLSVGPSSDGDSSITGPRQKNTQRVASRRRRSASQLNGEQSRVILNAIRTEITHVKGQLRAEKQARLETEQQIVKLTKENELLRQQLASCDETSLATIEATFAKFNDFLKQLHNVGYGPLLNTTMNTAFSSNVPFGDVLNRPSQWLHQQQERKSNVMSGSSIQKRSSVEVSEKGNVDTISTKFVSVTENNLDLVNSALKLLSVKSDNGNSPKVFLGPKSTSNNGNNDNGVF